MRTTTPTLLTIFLLIISLPIVIADPLLIDSYTIQNSPSQFIPVDDQAISMAINVTQAVTNIDTIIVEVTTSGIIGDPSSQVLNFSIMGDSGATGQYPDNSTVTINNTITGASFSAGVNTNVSFTGWNGSAGFYHFIIINPDEVFGTGIQIRRDDAGEYGNPNATQGYKTHRSAGNGWEDDGQTYDMWFKLWIVEGDILPPPLAVEWETLSPLNNTFLVNPFTVYFNLSNVNGTANCTLFINGTNSGTLPSLSNGLNSFPAGADQYSNAVKSYQLTCIDSLNTANSTLKIWNHDTIGDVNWQGYAPTNNTVLSSAQNQTFYYNISHFNSATCDFSVDGVKNTSESGLVNNTLYSFDYTVSDNTIATTNFGINCTDDTFGFIQAYSTNKTLTIDTVPPVIITTLPSPLNTTIVDETLTLDIFISDPNLNNTLYNITNSSGVFFAQNLTLDIAQVNFTFSDVIDVSTWDYGVYRIELSAGS